MTNPKIEIDIEGMLENMDDAEKVEAVKIMISNITTRGLIDEIRKLVNDQNWDD